MDQQKNIQEIDLLSLINKLLKQRTFIIKISTLCMFTGMFISFLMPNKFSAGSTFVPMLSSDSKSSGLSGLASLAGIDIGGAMASNDIAPNLYPEITASIPFKRELSLVKVPYQGRLITFKEYTSSNNIGILSDLKKYTLGLPGLILSYLFPKSSIVVFDTKLKDKLLLITEEDYLFYNSIDQLISINVDLKEGFIELNVELDDPVIAAIIAQNAQEILQKKVIEFKVKHAKEVLQYNKEQYKIKKAALYAAQDRLNGFKDNAIFFNPTALQTQTSRLESEYTTANMVFLEVAKQLEQSKLQVSKDTPIFSVLKPVVVPNEKSGPKRLMIIVIWSFIGFIIASGKVLLGDRIHDIIEKLK
jgi:LPS O-antigen subunit length determinant protein (WzzB/FepE family)